MKGLNNATTRGRDALVASLALLLALFTAPSAFAAWQAGLQEGFLHSSMDKVSYPTTWNSVLHPVAVTKNEYRGNLVVIYKGQIYLDGSQYWFVEKTWLASYLKIDGEVLVDNPNWYVTTTATITREAGWYDFEYRIWSDPNDGLGHAGLTDINGKTCGIGYVRQEAKPSGMGVCLYPEDDGTMNIFRYDDGTGFPGINVFGDPEELGEPDPDYGLNEDVTAGTSYELTCPELGTNTAETIVYRCVGWELKVNDEVVRTNTAANVRKCVYDCTNAADKAAVTWRWEIAKYKLDISTSGAGSVDETTQWTTNNQTVTVTATPGEGQTFWRWSGDVTAAMRYRTTASVTISGAPTSLVANFYDPATAARVIRYVVPDGAGTKDGTSWENAFSDLTTAYNAVVDNPVGGEVWLKKGRYALDTALALVPNVSVRGGFAGGETLASEADPANNPTILSLSTYKRSTDTWNDKNPMWTGDDMLTFVEPKDYGDSNIQFSSSNGGSAFENTDGSLIGNNEFTGLDFFRFGVCAFKLTTRQTTPVVFRNCRLLCCGWLSEDQNFPFQIDNVPVELTDCTFICCRHTARIKADTTVTTNILRRCRFYVGGAFWRGRNIQPCAGCLAIGGTAYAHLDHCWIEKGQESDGGGGGDSLAGGLVINTSVGGLIEDTVIRRNVAPGSCYGAGLTINMTSSPKLIVNRCRFEKNRYSGSGRGDSPYGGAGCAVGIRGGGTIHFNDCAFLGNIVTR